MSLDWLSNARDLLKIMVGAGLGSAFVQAVMAYFTEQRSKRAKADFLDQNLVGRGLNLQNERDRQQRLVGETVYYVEDDAEKHTAIAAAEVGLAAWRLAEKLRMRHGLMASQPDPEAAERLGRRAAWARGELAKDCAKSAKDWATL